MIYLEWKRTEDGGLNLWVKEEGNWKHYKQAKYYKPDAAISSQSGFATFQYYLSLSKERNIQLTINKTKDATNI